ncbi:DUF2027 domain-containing protein [Maribellus sediminis]|uniref:DUF2027 domain-containing protein n=1 Tax=Maribellus sediminis TaxID=2696285 RepID=UPI0014322678|nr:DUF2027 domain-containing protein [Maribellus sediminis]
MIKVGDRVKFLNDVGGGVVTGFLSKNMVNVEGDDGFEVPYPINQLVNVSAPELNVRGNVPEPVQAEENSAAAPVFVESDGEVINGKDAPEFYFCIVPSDAKNPLNGEIEVFLVNDSNFKLLYTYSYLTEQGVELVESGAVKSNARVKIDSLTQEDLSTLPDFGFQLLRFRGESNEWFPPVVKRFRVNPVRFYKASSFQPNSYFKRPAMILKIAAELSPDNLDVMTEADFKQLVKEKTQSDNPAKPARKRTTDEVVIDLHITELLDNSEGLSNREILEIQMDRVESEMNAAIRDHVKRIVFIHGVGQGVLKQEVAKLLQSKFKKYYHQDASFKEYGYGATMVILRR